MEEGGHYYTVYYASLAVGFNNSTAKKQATIAQMPDEVGWLDASNLHSKQCLNDNETDLHSVSRNVPSNWRYQIEYGVHSLPGVEIPSQISSDFQRRYTVNELAHESPVSLKFGLLLHRLGDSFAHSYMGHETEMYTVTKSDKCFSDPRLSHFGHLRHMHDPDYAFLRPDLFYAYLSTLYNALLSKVNEKGSVAYRNKNFRPKAFANLKNEFNDIFQRLTFRVKIADDQIVRDNIKNYSYSEYGAGSTPLLTNKETKARWLIEEIRNASIRNLHTDMGAYHPENEDNLSLREFLRRHPELNNTRITPETIEKTVREMVPAEPPVPVPKEIPQYPVYEQWPIM